VAAFRHDRETSVSDTISFRFPCGALFWDTQVQSTVSPESENNQLKFKLMPLDLHGHRVAARLGKHNFPAKMRNVDATRPHYSDERDTHTLNPFDLRRAMPTARRIAIALCLAGAVCAAHAQQALDIDVPYVTTPTGVTEAMLAIARVTKKDYLIDLGSGDGRIVIMAASKFGARGLGVEIDPQLVAQSRANAARAGVTHRAAFRDQDLFKTDLSRASVITMYLLPDVNLLLRPKLLDLAPGTRIVSHDWDMGDWQPDAEQRVAAPEKKLGLDRTSRVMLWTVPAPVEGRWCSRAHRGVTVTLRQRYQHFEGDVSGAVSLAYTGRIHGARLTAGDTDWARWAKGRLTIARAPLAGTWVRSERVC
jgi:SAM-dependent methyltransferase